MNHEQSPSKAFEREQRKFKVSADRTSATRKVRYIEGMQANEDKNCKVCSLTK